MATAAPPPPYSTSQQPIVYSQQPVGDVYIATVQPPPPPTGVVVVSTPAVAVVTFGDNPIQTTCPNCHNSVLTTVVYEAGGLTWLIFGILCFLFLWICAFIPFCLDSCKDAVHICPSCHYVICRHRRL